MWRCFLEGSWASPQLAVGLYLRDPNFAANALETIQNWPNVREISAPPLLRRRLPVDRKSSFTPIDGGDLWDHRGARALISLALQIPTLGGCVEEVIASPLGETIRSNDLEDGAGLAMGWLYRATMLFRANGVRLERCHPTS